MNTKRRLQFESLDQRAMFAVLSIDPQAGGDPGQMLVDAVRQANASDGPDEIFLAAGTYDLSTASFASLAIDSEIALRGEFPSSVKIVPQDGFSPIVVSQQGSLNLSNLTIFTTWADHGGGVRVNGNANIANVAFIGLGHDVQGGLFNATLPSSANSALWNNGIVDVSNSLFVDSLGTAVFNNAGTLDIQNSIVAGNFSGIRGVGSAVDGVGFEGGQISIGNSLIVLNSEGVTNLGATTTVGNTTIFGNGHTLEDHSGLLGGGLMVFSSNSTIESDNVVLGNISHSPLLNTQREQLTISLNDVFVSSSFLAMAQVDLANQADAYSLGTPAQVLERMQGKILLPADAIPTGYSTVNSPMTITDGVADYASGQGLSQVYWNDQSQQFAVSVGARDILSQFAAEIPDQAVRAYRDHWGKVHILQSVAGDTPAPLPTLFSATTYEFLDVSSVKATSGARFDLQQPRSTLWGYQPSRSYVGEDTIFVQGTDHLGIQRSYEIQVSVIGGLDIQLFAKTSESDGVVDFELYTSGQDLLSNFGSAIQYDASVVRVIDVVAGSGRTVDQKGDFTSSAIAPRVSVAAKADRSEDPGTELMTLRFERIGDGDPAIRLSPALYWAADSGQFTDLSSGSMDITYLDAVDSIFGDVNSDGSLTPLDALLILNHLSQPEADGEFNSRLDTNGDGKVAPIDALVIINRLADEAFSINSAVAAILSNPSRPSDEDDEDETETELQNPVEIRK